MGAPSASCSEGGGRVNFEPAVRRNVPLLIGIAGPSGSGKTYSTLRLATGIAGGKPIAFIDTERGRALHYADEFEFLHAELDDPFSPQRYGEAIAAAVALDPSVIVIDSFSHEWAGEGGVLDMQQAEFERMGSREAVKFASWIKPKAAHKSLVNDVLLRLPCHLIVCLRAESKVEMVKDEKTGKLEIVEKKTLAGHKGWIPVCGKELPYELTISLVVTPDAPGVPKPIKLQEQHRSLVLTDVPLDEATGERLAAWARGTTSDAEPSPTAAHPAAGAGGSGTEPAPSAPVPEPPASPPGSDGPAPTGGSGPSHEENIRALDALVTSLAEGNIVTKRQVWVAVARMRSKPVDDMIDLYDGKGDDGDVHWSPLRKILRPEEAVELRTRLSAKWAESREAVSA